ncbi:MAG: hypothetical protein GF308_12735 [Candidatus Heimdallarchaeota archaeon]|nr:hypothetical protein [Candidatus Heimdallarchaeota archaeon]
MSDSITYEELIRIVGKNAIPADIDKDILMKHFQILFKRIIGDKTIEKIQAALESSIESTRSEQSKMTGRVLDSPLSLLSNSQSKKLTTDQTTKEDKYGLKSIKRGLVSQRLKERQTCKESKEEQEKEQEKIARISEMTEQAVKSLDSLETDIEKHAHLLPPVGEDTDLPSIEELTVLSGGQLERIEEKETETEGKVRREIAIRNYQVKDETRSVRWGKETILDRKGNPQEINNPVYIFHSDLWQLEKAREPIEQQRCEILQHVILDMVANNINVVMLEGEKEPYFVVEGFGILQSKDTLRDRIKINSLIQLLVISCEAWEIALKQPEALIKGRDKYGKTSFHAIDMTSVIPLADVRNSIVEIDNEFKANYRNPEKLIKKTLRLLQNHRKNIVWSCGEKTIDYLRQAVREHRSLVDKPTNSLNMILIGTKRAYHPIKAKAIPSEGKLIYEELLPDYCHKNHKVSDTALKAIFGSLPAIFDSTTSQKSTGDIAKIAIAVYQRLGYSALELLFDPGYIKGNPSDIMPISKLDIILPLNQEKMQEKFKKKGFKII